MSDGSGETNVPIEDWTTGSLKIFHDEKIASLKVHIEQRFTDNDKAIQAALVSQEKAVAAALAAAKEAVSKAEAASEKRFESVNEFRQTLSDQTASFLPRPEYDANHKALEDKIDTKCKALEDKIQALTDRLNISTGKSSGISAAWGSIGVAIGLLIAAVSVILTFNN